MPKKKTTGLPKVAYKNLKWEERQKQKAEQRKSYDRQELLLPCGWKNKLKEVSSSMGISVNDYVCRLIKADIDQDHKPDDLVSMLLKWEVKEKYHSMIESASFTKSQGYFIRLKTGFINDLSGTNEIIQKNVKDLRHSMQFTHPVRNTEDLCGLDSMTYEQLVRWQVPKNRIQDIKGVGDHQIIFKDGTEWKFKSVSELRYMWKSKKEG